MTLPPLPPAPSANLILFSTQQWTWLTGAITAMYAAHEADLAILAAFINSQEALMATVSDLTAKLDAIEAALTGPNGVSVSLENVKADVASLKALIESLKAQIVAGTPVSQVQLDALVAKADGIAVKASSASSALATLAASTPDQPTPQA